MRYKGLILISLFAGLGALILVIAALAMPTVGVRGTVILTDGDSAEGAWVRVQTTDNLTFADADGEFVLDDLDEGITVTFTAWFPEYKVGWVTVVPPADDITITLNRYATGDNPEYEWNTSYPDPENTALGCGHCMLPAFNEWQHTAHASSGMNPRFLSLYNGTDITGMVTVSPGYLLDFPGTVGNCATCHAPGAAHDAPFTTNMNELEGVNLEGVFCEFCHKVGDVYLDPITSLPYDNAPGVISMRLYRPFPTDQLFFGSLDDVTRRVSYLPLEKSSQFCAPCHQFAFWGTPIYESYAEWLASPYPAQGIECQTCHMPAGTTQYFAPPELGGLPRSPDRLATHLDLGLKDTGFMQNTITMTLSAVQVGNQIEVNVALKNFGAGHHVPTDHPGRHLILVLEAEDEEGNYLAYLTGPTVPEWGGIEAGMPGTAYAKVLQDVLTKDYPVVSYWNQTAILSDNRIPALGTAVSNYIFSHPGYGGTVTIMATLFLRRTFQAEMDARGWGTNDILMESATLALSTEPGWLNFLPIAVR
jgi:hypothetical protein